MNTSAHPPPVSEDATREDPQVGDIVLVAVSMGYIMQVLAIDTSGPEPYLCCTYPDASYRWENSFVRADLYAVLVKADGTVVADPESLPMCVLAYMQRTRSCITVYEDAPPWKVAPRGYTTVTVVEAPLSEERPHAARPAHGASRPIARATAGRPAAQASTPRQTGTGEKVEAPSLWDIAPGDPPPGRREG